MKKSKAIRRISPARSQDVLLKRIRRLLRLDQPNDQSELTLQVIPFLNSLGPTALIGGAIRDVARAGKRGFNSDLDFVIYGGSRDKFAARMSQHGSPRNKFGGYRLVHFQTEVDVWHIEDTWARTAGLVDVSAPADLLKCTFFDWDSIIYDLSTGKLVLPSDYLERLQFNLMDIRLEENPNIRGSLVRALRRAALWGVKFGPKLTEFSKRHLQAISWPDLIDLDSRAFSSPVLKFIDEAKLHDRLDAFSHSAVGSFTVPVPDWTEQLSLRF